MRNTATKLASLIATALGAWSVLHIPAAGAQSSQACPNIENDKERLACYDRALRPAPAAPAKSAPPAAAAPSSSVSTEDRASRRERRARDAAAEAPAANAPPARSAAVDPIAPAPAPAPVARPASEAAQASAAPEVRHSRASTQTDAEPAIVPIVVVQIRSFPGRPATFVTDTGETWVQTDSQRQLPSVPFKAAIKPGSMSSFFLVPDDYAHSFRVRPAK